ncbi:hypothetical protein [Nocardioides sp. CER19]|uniref:hypothetical protein n=1 Tax=Nocardioides sp. CER19 TaxID=3038538 RepID=UPI00244A6051|nr:hypothetical protein [Nocardioides sp. CER19]MDH2413857.1 hypothetical protein [Nocardioides sp. CER19]
MPDGLATCQLVLVRELEPDIRALEGSGDGYREVVSSIELAHWVSGLATTAAVIVALWFSAHARTDARHQALHRVYAWAEFAPVLHSAGYDDGWKLVFSNLTDIPVFRWAATVEWTSRADHRERITLTNVSMGLLAPGRSECAWNPAKPPTSEASIEVALVFEDAAGEKWVRRGTGLLARATPTERALLSAAPGPTDVTWTVWPGSHTS